MLPLSSPNCLGRGVLGVLAVLTATGPDVRAVIFRSTADPSFNTEAPAGKLAESGWQWVGRWGGSTGTTVGPRHFLAARHIGGAVGEIFEYRGIQYETVGFLDDAESDLRLWQTSRPLPAWTALYRRSDEVGRDLVVIGRGHIRGEEVRDRQQSGLRGWRWTPGDGRMRWGTNRILSVVDRGTGWGNMLYARFDFGADETEAHLALNDSGAPVFIHDGQGWKLAGVAGAVDAYFNTEAAGPGFNAAIFDARELHFGREGSWGERIKGPRPIPSGFYSTRISARAAWIEQALADAELDQTVAEVRGRAK